MAAGTENQVAVVAEKRVILIDCNRVGRCFLFRHPDIDFNTHLLFDARFHLCKFSGKCLPVRARHSEVHVDSAVGLASRLRTFHKLLFNRGTCPVSCMVEGQQPFREVAIVQPVG